MEYDLRYAVLDSNLIFNVCGPLSAGPIGWDEPNIKKREVAAQKYISIMNRKQGFYTKLEKSILQEGVRNPILVKCGWCPERTLRRLPISMQKNINNILVCDSNGGSRLWVAQKHDLKISCLISDFVGRFSNEQLVEKTSNAALKFFKDKPEKLVINDHGIGIYDLPQVHLED